MTAIATLLVWDSGAQSAHPGLGFLATFAAALGLALAYAGPVAVLVGFVGVALALSWARSGVSARTLRVRIRSLFSVIGLLSGLGFASLAIWIGGYHRAKPWGCSCHPVSSLDSL